jgi:catechol 2,3-dioxygenase-like lactoylglutathione lyase family enzyme
MQVIDKFMTLQVGVCDLPKTKAFYADKLGLKVTTDYRANDDNRWAALTLPEAGLLLPSPHITHT